LLLEYGRQNRKLLSTTELDSEISYAYKKTCVYFQYYPKAETID